jgi:predicted DNA-binding protein YlxM (UPF0122 family)
MASYFSRTVDPKIIENTYSVPEQDFDEYEDKSFDLESLQEYLSLLPLKEIDLIEMYYKGKKKQKEIAEFFDVSQGAISHRINRAKKRLIFLRNMPKVDDKDLVDRLNDLFHEIEVDIIFFMTKTTCQSKTAELVNDKHSLSGKSKMTQVKVRHKFEKAIDKLVEKAGEGVCSDSGVSYVQVAKLVEYIKKNPYMLHEVKLSHFDKGSKVDHSVS